MKSEIFGCRQCGFRGFSVPDNQVTIVAKQPSNRARVMTMVDAKFSSPMRANISPRRLPADSAKAVLLKKKEIVLFDSNPVTMFKMRVAMSDWIDRGRPNPVHPSLFVVM
jgi:hypothetical protein